MRTGAVCTALALLAGSLACDGGVAAPGADVLEPHELCSEHDGSAVVTFADPGVALAVSHMLSGAAPSEITCDQVALLWVLFLPGSVGSLDGLQNLTRLTQFGATGGPLSDLTPIASLPIRCR